MRRRLTARGHNESALVAKPWPVLAQLRFANRRYSSLGQSPALVGAALMLTSIHPSVHASVGRVVQGSINEEYVEKYMEMNHFCLLEYRACFASEPGERMQLPWHAVPSQGGVEMTRGSIW